MLLPKTGQGIILDEIGFWIYESYPFLILRAWKRDTRGEDLILNSYELSKEGLNDAIEFYNHILSKHSIITK